MSATMTKSIYIRVARRRLQPDQRRLERTNDGVAAVPPVGGVGGIGGAGGAGGAGELDASWQRSSAALPYHACATTMIP